MLLKLQMQKRRRRSFCGAYQYFDGINVECVSCRVICRPPSMSFCIRNCPKYYRKHRKLFESQVTVEVTAATTCVPGQPSTLFVNPVNGSTVTAHVTTHVPSPEYSQVRRALFWMSLVSMFVVLVYTIAVVVLCFKPRFRKVRRPTGTHTLRSSVKLRPSNGYDESHFTILWPESPDSLQSRPLPAIPSAAPGEDEVRASRREDVDDDADDDDYNELTSVIIRSGDNIDLRSTTSQTVGFSSSNTCTSSDIIDLRTASQTVRFFSGSSSDERRMSNGLLSIRTADIHPPMYARPVQVSSVETRCCDESVAEEDCTSSTITDQHSGEDQTIPKLV